MKVKNSDLVIPDNIEIVFEHYCSECDKCEPVIITSRIKTGEETEEINRVTCNNTQICRKVRTIAATEKAKEYPFV